MGILKFLIYGRGVLFCGVSELPGEDEEDGEGGEEDEGEVGVAVEVG